MPKAIKTCKVCGKQYEACCTPNPYMVFRWFDVACSKECAAEYLRRIEESRRVDPDPTGQAEEKEEEN